MAHTMITVAKWLHAAMMNQQLTQSDMANLSGVPRPRVSDIIRGAAPTIEEMTALVGVLARK